MRLVRFDDAGFVTLGVLDGGSIVPLSALKAEYPTMLSIVTGGEARAQAHFGRSRPDHPRG